MVRLVIILISDGSFHGFYIGVLTMERLRPLDFHPNWKWCIACQRFKYFLFQFVRVSNHLFYRTKTICSHINVNAPLFIVASSSSSYTPSLSIRFFIKHWIQCYHRNLHPEQLFTGWPSVIVMLGWLTSSSAVKVDCFSYAFNRMILVNNGMYTCKWVKVCELTINSDANK